MQALFDLLKIVALMTFLVAVGCYVFIQGLPPRDKGRWRKTLESLEGTKQQMRKPGQK